MFTRLNNKRLICTGILIAFLGNLFFVQHVAANEVVLPAPGAMVHLSPTFNPPVLAGIKVDPKNPLRFEFVLSQGDKASPEAKGESTIANEDFLKQESTKLIKYFLASLTVPEKDLWVNLSPYEKDHIVPDAFGQTEMGRDLLAQDYILKQITASLMYPEDEVGKKFWKRVYEESANKFGTSNLPVNTFNKVWIVPEKAVVYENAKVGTAYVVESRLKVLTEIDYLAGQKNNKQEKNNQIIKDIVIPVLTKEVNEGKNFAQLRQVYNSLILATWYKKKLKSSILSQVYADKNKVAGTQYKDTNVDFIYQRYLEAFKKGVYNYIKEEQDPITHQSIPKKYFSGGFFGAAIDQALSIEAKPLPEYYSQHSAVVMRVNLNEVQDKAMGGTRKKGNDYPGIGINDAFMIGNLKYMVAGQSQVKNLLYYLKMPKVNDVKSYSFELKLGDDSFVFTKKDGKNFGYPSIYWSLPKERFQELINILNLMKNDQMPATSNVKMVEAEFKEEELINFQTEVRVYQSKNELYTQGRTAKGQNGRTEFGKVLFKLPKPEHSSVKTQTIKIAGQEFILHLRAMDGNDWKIYTWVINKQDEQRFDEAVQNSATYREADLSDVNKEDDIVIFPNSYGKLELSDFQNFDLVNRFKVSIQLPRITSYADKKFDLVVGDQNFVLERKYFPDLPQPHPKRGIRIVWTIHRSELGRIKQALSMLEMSSELPLVQKGDFMIFAEGDYYLNLTEDHLDPGAKHDALIKGVKQLPHLIDLPNPKTFKDLYFEGFVGDKYFKFVRKKYGVGLLEPLQRNVWVLEAQNGINIEQQFLDALSEASDRWIKGSIHVTSRKINPQEELKQGDFYLGLYNGYLRIYEVDSIDVETSVKANLPDPREVGERYDFEISGGGFLLLRKAYMRKDQNGLRKVYVWGIGKYDVARLKSLGESLRSQQWVQKNDFVLESNGKYYFQRNDVENVRSEDEFLQAKDVLDNFPYLVQLPSVFEYKGEIFEGTINNEHFRFVKKHMPSFAKGERLQRSDLVWVLEVSNKESIVQFNRALEAAKNVPSKDGVLVTDRVIAPEEEIEKGEILLQTKDGHLLVCKTPITDHWKRESIMMDIPEAQRTTERTFTFVYDDQTYVLNKKAVILGPRMMMKKYVWALEARHAWRFIDIYELRNKAEQLKLPLAQTTDIIIYKTQHTLMVRSIDNGDEFFGVSSSRFPNVLNYKNVANIVKIGRHVFTFAPKKDPKTGMAVLTLPIKDYPSLIEEIRREMGKPQNVQDKQLEFPPVNPDDVFVPPYSNGFIDGQFNLLDFPYFLSLPDSNRKITSYQVQVGDEVVVFRRKIINDLMLWSITKSDFERIKVWIKANQERAHFPIFDGQLNFIENYLLPGEIQYDGSETTIRLNSSGNFVVEYDSRSLPLIIENFGLTIPDPMTETKDQIKIQVGEKEFILRKQVNFARRTRPSGDWKFYIWVMSNEDRKRFIAAVDEINKKNSQKQSVPLLQAKDNEVVILRNGISSMEVIHREETLLFNFVFLPSLYKNQLTEIEHEIGGEKFKFQHRWWRKTRRGNIKTEHVWAIDEHEKGRLIAAIYRQMQQSKIGRERSENSDGFTKARNLTEEQRVQKVIEEEDLTSVVSSLMDEPYLLLQYLFLTTQLDPKTIHQIVRVIYEGFKGVEYDEISLDDFQELDYPTILDPNVIETKESIILIQGKVKGPFDQVRIDGDRKRVISVGRDGAFTTKLILKAGDQLSLMVTPFNAKNSVKGRGAPLEIRHMGKAKSIDEIILEMLTLKSDMIEKLKQDKVRMAYLRKKIEVSLLIYFTESELNGFRFLERKIKSAKDPFVLEIYKSINEKFEKISQVNYPALRGDEKYYFFQKYVIFELMKEIRRSERNKSLATDYLPARIIAIDQGLGKTLMSLAVALMHKKGTTVISPKSLVSMWGAEGSRFFEQMNLQLVQGTAAEKTKALGQGFKNRVVNMEYLRGLKDDARYQALNGNPQQINILDEGQPFSRDSLQAQGALRLSGLFTLILSATPFADPKAALKLLIFLRRQAGLNTIEFDLTDPDAVRKLHFLMDDYILRISQKDVFKYYDPNKPLQQQKDRLPVKDYIEPQDMGAFELSLPQTDAIYDLFFNGDAFVKKYGDFIQKPDGTLDDDREQEKVLSKNRRFFTMKNIMRRLINDPHYLGIEIESPKHLAMDKIIDKEVIKAAGKVVIFAAYTDQVEAYQQRYEKFGAVTYYGATLKDRRNSQDFLTDNVGKVRKFKMDARNEYVIVNGHLVEDLINGMPIKVLDYNRIRFQNDPNVKVLIATYNTGSLGNTFTAANAVVLDDLARDYTDRYQSEGRIPRISKQFKNYTTRIYQLQARYPKDFIESLKGKYGAFDPQLKRWVILEKSDARIQQYSKNKVRVWNLYLMFRRGTYDQIAGKNMDIQKRLFELVLNGIQSIDDIELLQRKGLERTMPFLFEQSAQSDSAMAAPGGIDLTSDEFVSIKQEGIQSFDFKMDPAMLRRLEESQGFEPQIISIVPVGNIKEFLSL